MTEENVSVSEPIESDVSTESSESSDLGDGGSPEVNAETKEEFQEEVADAIEAGATEEQINNMVKEFELKVNGQVVKKKFDFSKDEDIESLKRELQMGEANKQGMQKASQYEKAYESFLNEAKANPWKILQELGLDPDELAESRLYEKVEQLKKSPEQLEKERIFAELEEARAKLKEQEERSKAMEFERLKESEKVKFEREVDEALGGHKTLPKTPKTVSRIADAMVWAMQQGYDNVSVADVLPLVEKDIKREMNELLDVLPEEFLENYIGKKNIERLRKKRIEAHSKKASSVDSIVKPVSKEETKDPYAKKERMSQKDFFKMLGK